MSYPGAGKSVPDFQGQCTFETWPAGVFELASRIKADRGAFAKFGVGDRIEIRGSANNDASVRTVTAIAGDASSSFLILDLPVKKEGPSPNVVNRIEDPADAPA